MYCKRVLCVICLCIMFLLTGCQVSYDPQLSQDIENRISDNIEKNKQLEDETFKKFSESADSVYYETLDRLTNSANESVTDGMPPDEYLLRSALRAYSTVRSLAPFIVLGSIGIGLGIWIAARKNKTLRKLGIYGFIMGIPLFVLLFVFGIGIFFDLLVL